MHRLVPLLPLLLFAACAAPATQEPAPSSPSAAVAPAMADAGTFILIQGQDTAATERFARTAGQLDAELSAPNEGRVVYTAALAPDATVPRIELRAYPSGSPAGAEPAQRSVAVFRGDSVFTENATQDSTRSNRVGTVAGAIPYINPSPSLMEQIVRRARAMGGERVEVPVFVAGSGGQTVTAAVAFLPPDSATLSLAGTEVRARVDEVGRLLGASVPAQGLTVTRTTGTTR